MIYRVEEADAGMRLDRFAAEAAGISRSAAAALAAGGHIAVNGVPAPKKYRVAAKDSVQFDLPEAQPLAVEPQDIPLDIVYEDADILLINKPSGMVVHPAPANESATLVNALLYHCGERLSAINGVLRPGIVHRLDKDTSGLLVVAKNDAAHRALAAQLEGHHIVREYYALVRGGFAEDRGSVHAPIGRHPTDRKKMAVLRPGEGTARDAITHWEVMERFGQVTLLRLILETGRTHQIRVHMRYIGHPLLGDPVYGAGDTVFERQHPDLFDGQMLHAKTLTFRHPTSGEKMHFTCELPPNFLRALHLLREKR